MILCQDLVQLYKKRGGFYLINMYKKSKEYVLREINDSYFLMSSGKCINRKWVYQLNKTGAKIWELCDICGNFQEMIDCLEESYNRKFIDDEKKGIYAYMSQLEKEKLIIEEKNEVKGITENNI